MMMRRLKATVPEPLESSVPIGAGAALLASLVFVASAVSAQEQTGATRTTGPIRFNVSGGNRVTVIRDVRYKQLDGGVLTLDLYNPSHRAKSGNPIVVVLHGGPFSPDSERLVKNDELSRSLGRALAAQGMAAAIISYRFYGGTMLGAAGDDVQDAIAYLRSHAAALAVDSNRVCLLAFSGGAHFFALAIREQPAYIRCLVGLSPAFGLVRGADSLQRVAPLDALRSVEALRVPVFVSRAGADESGLVREWSAVFIDGAIRKNADVEVHNTARAHHGFEGADSDDSQRIFHAVFGFLKRTLGPGISSTIPPNDR